MVVKFHWASKRVCHLQCPWRAGHSDWFHLGNSYSFLWHSICAWQLWGMSIGMVTQRDPALSCHLCGLSPYTLFLHWWWLVYKSLPLPPAFYFRIPSLVYFIMTFSTVSAQQAYFKCVCVFKNIYAHLLRYVHTQPVPGRKYRSQILWGGLSVWEGVGLGARQQTDWLQKELLLSGLTGMTPWSWAVP